MKPILWVQFGFLAVIAVIVVGFVRSCSADPSQLQLFEALTSMRADMDKVVVAGGRVLNYDNNGKTTFARVYLLLSVDADSRSQELLTRYKTVLISQGWVPVRASSRGLDLCKQGAMASVLASNDDARLSVDMAFDAASAALCVSHDHRTDR